MRRWIVVPTGIALGLLTVTLAGAESPEARAALRDQVVAQERGGLDLLKKGDIAAFAQTVASDAIFVDDHGPATRSEVVEHTASFKLDNYTMTDIRFVALSPSSGLLSYEMKESGTSHGHAFSADVYVSSVWAQRSGSWQCLFSQETAARTPHP
jgi:Domain of unknown function (DUF4440)